MTWGEFKKVVEDQHVTDETLLSWIAVHAGPKWGPVEAHVTTEHKVYIQNGQIER